MAEENIKVIIDDTELDMYIAKLQLAQSIAVNITGTPKIMRGTKDLTKEWKTLEKTWTQLVAKEPDLLRRFADMDLPSLNREMRVLIGLIPGGRQASQFYFMPKRLQRAVKVGLEEQTMFPVYLSLLATAIILLRYAVQFYKDVERREREYEMMIRRYRGFTHSEYVEEMTRWKEYRRGLPG